jgi:hypothetical protein
LLALGCAKPPVTIGPISVSDPDGRGHFGDKKMEGKPASFKKNGRFNVQSRTKLTAEAGFCGSRECVAAKAAPRGNHSILDHRCNRL